jgi:hypothetical protein
MPDGLHAVRTLRGKHTERNMLCGRVTIAPTSVASTGTGKVECRE